MIAANHYLWLKLGYNTISLAVSCQIFNKIKIYHILVNEKGNSGNSFLPLSFGKISIFFSQFGRWQCEAMSKFFLWTWECNSTHWEFFLSERACTNFSFKMLSIDIFSLNFLEKYIFFLYYCLMLQIADFLLRIIFSTLSFIFWRLTITLFEMD